MYSYRYLSTNTRTFYTFSLIIQACSNFVRTNLISRCVLLFVFLAATPFIRNSPKNDMQNFVQVYNPNSLVAQKSNIHLSPLLTVNLKQLSKGYEQITGKNKEEFANLY